VKPFVITTANPIPLEVGMVIAVTSSLRKSKNYRVIEVISRTQVRVDRPWWMPLWTLWSRLPFGRWARSLRQIVRDLPIISKE